MTTKAKRKLKKSKNMASDQKAKHAQMNCPQSKAKNPYFELTISSFHEMIAHGPGTEYLYLPPGGGVLWEFLGGDVALGPWNP